MGFEINDFLTSFIGKTGVVLLLATSLIIYCVVHFRVTYESLQEKMEERAKQKELKRLQDEKLELLKRKEEKAQEEINKFKKYWMFYVIGGALLFSFKLYKYLN